MLGLMLMRLRALAKQHHFIGKINSSRKHAKTKNFMLGVLYVVFTVVANLRNFFKMYHKLQEKNWLQIEKKNRRRRVNNFEKLKRKIPEKTCKNCGEIEKKITKTGKKNDEKIKLKNGQTIANN